MNFELIFLIIGLCSSSLCSTATDFFRSWLFGIELQRFSLGPHTIQHRSICGQSAVFLVSISHLRYARNLDHIVRYDIHFHDFKRSLLPWLFFPRLWTFSWTNYNPSTFCWRLWTAAASSYFQVKCFSIHKFLLFLLSLLSRLLC